MANHDHGTNPLTRPPKNGPDAQKPDALSPPPWQCMAMAKTAASPTRGKAPKTSDTRPGTENTVPEQNLPPNQFRRLLAEIFADAEDHGLGTWAVTFNAAPDKTEEAANFIESRAALLAETRLSQA